MNRSLAKRIACVAVAVFTALCAVPAFAHPSAHHAAMSIASGFAHPFSGWDHMLAFGAIGIWIARQRQALWLLPCVFLLSIAAGMAAGIAAFGMPGLEASLAVSVAAAGLLLVFELHMPAPMSALIVSAFAFLHGYVHGVELPQQASATWYGIGLVAATALLQLGGVGAGAIFSDKIGGKIIRVLGAGVAVIGAYLVEGTI